MSTYGNKRDYPKIDFYHRRPNGTNHYCGSTTWSRTCREALARFPWKKRGFEPGSVSAYFTKVKS